MISQKRAFEIVEIGQADDRTSRFCDIFFFILIIVNVIAVCLETVDSIYANYKTIFKAIEFISVSIFALNMRCEFGPRRLPQILRMKTRLQNVSDTYLVFQV